METKQLKREYEKPELVELGNLEGSNAGSYCTNGSGDAVCVTGGTANACGLGNSAAAPCYAGNAAGFCGVGSGD